MNWRTIYKKKIVTPTEAVSHIKSGDAIVLQQGHGLSQILVDALVKRAEELKDIKIVNMTCFGREEYLRPEFQKTFNYYTTFLQPNTRDAYYEGRVNYVPDYFVNRCKWLRDYYKPDVAILKLSLPDDEGFCSFSLNADYSVEAAKLSKTVIAHINPLSPKTYGSKISLDDVDLIVEQAEEIVETKMGRIDEKSMEIAKHIEPLIPNGATLQLGIGGLPDAILSLLNNKKDLGIQSEIFSDGVVDLFEKGVITNQRKNVDKGKMVATFLLGSKKLFDFVDNNPNVLMMPVDYTNDPYILSKNDNFISINSCLQVDLYGQVVSDFINGKQYSGVGGQVDTIRGADLSIGGKSFLCLPSTVKNDSISTIVCHLEKGTPITVSRYDVDYIVTEYGAVQLKGKTTEERVNLLISIAHPKFRAKLKEEAYINKMLFN